jgi:hypothetical protein
MNQPYEFTAIWAFHDKSQTYEYSKTIITPPQIQNIEPVA